MPIAALPTDALSLILAQLRLVLNIKGVKRTCRAFRDAAPAAEQAHRRVCMEEPPLRERLGRRHRPRRLPRALATTI